MCEWNGSVPESPLRPNHMRSRLFTETPSSHKLQDHALSLKHLLQILEFYWVQTEKTPNISIRRRSKTLQVMLLAEINQQLLYVHLPIWRSFPWTATQNNLSKMKIFLFTFFNDIFIPLQLHLMSLCWCQGKKTLLIWQQNNHVQFGDRNSASSQHAIVDHFPLTAQHGVFI